MAQTVAPCEPPAQASASPVTSRVDTLPRALRPLLHLYGWGVAAGMYGFFALQRLTVRVEVSGAERIRAGEGYVFCHWHGLVPLLFQAGVPRLPAALAGRPHAWMQHPLWYMKPVHVFLCMMGVREIVLGSSGHEGRRAADDIARLLRAGWSTVVLPDGPAGPPRVLKRGVLHLAARSGVPVVPLRIDASRRLTIPTWDRKQVPLPFSTISLAVGDPILVGDLDRAERELAAALG